MNTVHAAPSSPEGFEELAATHGNSRGGNGGIGPMPNCPLKPGRGEVGKRPSGGFFYKIRSVEA